MLACRDVDAKRVYYLSMEFLMGRSLLNALNNLGVVDQVCSPVIFRVQLEHGQAVRTSWVSHDSAYELQGHAVRKETCCAATRGAWQAGGPAWTGACFGWRAA